MRTRLRRVTVTLSASLLDAVDHKLARDDETRSAVIRRLVQNALREAEERAAEERWIRSYQKHPQTEDEIWPELIAHLDASDVPW